MNLSHLKAQLLHQNSWDEDILGVNSTNTQPTANQSVAKKDVKNIILNSSKHILGKVLSPTRDKNSINAMQHGTQPVINNIPVVQSDSFYDSKMLSDNSNIVKEEAEVVGSTNVVHPTTPTKPLDVITTNVSISHSHLIFLNNSVVDFNICFKVNLLLILNGICSISFRFYNFTTFYIILIYIYLENFIATPRTK